MPLTDPGTRSPGRIVIGYYTTAIEHLSAAWIKAGVDLDAELDDLRNEAITFANSIMDSCPNTSLAHTWYIVDPDGVQLVAENFVDVIAGTRTASDTIQSNSVQVSITGKGTVASVGTKSGVTRTTFFNGMFSAAFEMNKDFVVQADGVGWDLLQYLRDSEFVGCDKFGQKATYSSKALLQINAHWQREYGL